MNPLPKSSPFVSISPHFNTIFKMDPARNILGNASWQSIRKTLFFATVLPLTFLTAGCIDSENPPKIFEDASLASGLDDYKGMTHGAAWGDYDNDGLPDVYVTNHLKTAQLFHNLGGGRFADVSAQYFVADDLGGDKHGAAWADFNNDGRLDLIQLTGAVVGVGSEPKKLFLNRVDKFQDIAKSAQVDNIYGRTRMPLWIDLNRDGQLDLFEGAEARFDERVPPFLFMQNQGRFTVNQKALPLDSKSVPFCILTELNSDAYPEMVCRVAGKNRTTQIFDTAALPAKELNLLPASAFEDIAAGDFDNDGAIDLFLARKYPTGPIGLAQSGSNEVIADIWIGKENLDKPLGFDFSTSGQVNIKVSPAHVSGKLSAEEIHIGQTDRHPDGLDFSLSPETAGIQGTLSYQPGAQAGVYIGMMGPEKWQIFVSGAPNPGYGGKNKHEQIALRITSSEPITELSSIAGLSSNEEAPARLFMNRAGALVEESEKRGVNDRLVAATNVVAGDFDNDMDLDLFVLVSGDIGGQKNLLLLNDGKGYFEIAADAGGAAGNRIGVGDSVTTADFDQDGFLDLLTATGSSMGRSLGLPSANGGYHLYHNVGNGNHWLEIDLEGTASNRDGIGAKVELTVGNITQVRIQDGGLHQRGQNHQRLHFGLGKYALIDNIKIYWPSGKNQELQNVESNQIMRIVEP